MKQYDECEFTVTFACESEDDALSAKKIIAMGGMCRDVECEKCIFMSEKGKFYCPPEEDRLDI